MDTLAAATAIPGAQAPADKMSVQTNPQTGAVTPVLFQWSRISLATSYELQIALDANFTAMVLSATTAPSGTVANSGSTVAVLVGPGATIAVAFQPATTYYWRVRATLPVTTAFTAVRSFTTTDISNIANLNTTLLAPAAGSTNVPLRPTLQWSAVSGAATYDVVISKNADFTNPVINKTYVTNTVFVVDVDLAANTVYYWRVRGSTGTPGNAGQEGAWTTGVFTTGSGAATTTTQPQVTITTTTTNVTTTVNTITVPPTQNITPTWIYAIIAVGAILVIVVIVLIVRTRKA